MATGEYKGKKVKLDDPFRLPQGSSKKFGVYVKNPDTGNIIKVEYGDPNLSIKRDDPERLKNFRARHNCDQKTDKTTPGYWSCKFWEKGNPVSKLLKQGKVEEEGCDCGCDCKSIEEAVKVRIASDKEISVVQNKDGEPFVYDSEESAQKKAESIKGKVVKGTKGEIMVQVLIDPSLRKHLMFREYAEMTEGEWKDEKDEREHNKLFMKSLKTMPGSPNQKKIIQQMNALRKKNGLELLKEEKRIPKTRKNQDPDTHSDLYTDEDPRGTIHGLGFKDVETAEASVRKIKASDRTHAHKIQAAIAMEQRAKVMKKTAEAAVYRKFIEEMKKKTKEMNEEVYKDSGLGDWFGKGGGGGKESGGWDRFNTAGERIGKCGDAKKGAAYSACLSAEKAKQLGKKGIADFVRRKRDAQKKAGDKAKGGESKKGQKPVMVKTGAKGLDKKNESYMSFTDFISEGENVPNNPALWKKAIAKAKQKFDVYPSAYANAWASKWYKSKGGTWSKK
jgi:hypothetical protein